MDDETSPLARRRNRSQRSRLRKNQEIDHVKVEESFVLGNPNGSTDEAMVGEGCYVSTTLNNRRYYGVLIDQAALQAASMLHFQEEARGLDLNRRMKALQGQGSNGGMSESDSIDRKGPAAAGSPGGQSKKRPRSPTPTKALSNGNIKLDLETHGPRPVQKFRYHADGNSGYRVLLATYADVQAAAEGDPNKIKLIDDACQSGGNFIGEYYYQFEAVESSVSNGIVGMRLSVGFQDFLRTTGLPMWFPLSNLQTEQQKVLSLLSMKKDNKGNAIWDSNAETSRTMHAVNESAGSSLPMEPRSSYRVCVVGGGIAGLSCALEIIRKCERENINVEVVLVEGRGRLGGRLWTDNGTFTFNDGVTPFPVDLGASWIHGIDLNPLAALAREAGVGFVRTDEDVKMLLAGRVEVDHVKDKKAGELFDKLLDVAAAMCWGPEEEETKSAENQSAVRWYASGLRGETQGKQPQAYATPVHRLSNDVSVDRALGSAIAKQQRRDFESLSDVERRMLYWNVKNVEYALGANISDLSMKFWDIDERHAFEGDHVLLDQGYSSVVDHLSSVLKMQGSKFRCLLDFPVGKLEYARKTTTQTYTGPSRRQQVVDLSDTCCVTSMDGDLSIKCDLVVCAVPLGVLKEAATGSATGEYSGQLLEFCPKLPFSKCDAIQSVGFGLLDKVYLQFSTAFWRYGGVALGAEQQFLGNASGINPHHYMFFDAGRVLGRNGDFPAILMSLISGREAVACELMSEEALVKEAVDTLRLLFNGVHVPSPIAYKVTRWGSDPFARGSYTFLPPGTTDQDFQTLQSPVNGNGDSLLLEGSETMRLFFAGEHTTALHPSMAHGALLSGVRAAEEVVSTITLDFKTDDGYDRLIPMPIFRRMNPDSPLECSFCHLSGGRAYEGPLFAFKRGSRQVLAHNSCAEYSPEVEVDYGRWRNVVRAVNRSGAIECFLCGGYGASIGCNVEDCSKSFHFRCAEKTKWSFEDDGKEFYCEAHRDSEMTPGASSVKEVDDDAGGFQHALFATDTEKMDAAADEQEDAASMTKMALSSGDNLSNRNVEETQSFLRLTCVGDFDLGDTRLVSFERKSLNALWNIKFLAKPIAGTSSAVLTLVEADNDDVDVSDIVVAVNGLTIGEPNLKCLEQVVALFAEEVEVFIELRRREDQANCS